MIKSIKIKIKNLQENSFYKNIAKLMSGTIVAQSLPIFISPVLTRIYTPEQFGELAIFVSITLVIGSVATGRYELAIILPKKKSESINLLYVSILVTTLISLLSLFVIYFYENYFQKTLGIQYDSSFLLFTPLVIWFVGVSNSFSYYNTRNSRFKEIAISNVIKSIILVGTQLFFGIVAINKMGLVYGIIFSFVTFAFCLFRPNYNDLKRNKFNIIDAKLLLSKYKKFPLIMLPGTLLNSLSGNVMTIVIPLLFSTASLGFYSLAQRVLGAPSALIGSSISLVYTQEASEEKKKTGLIIKTFDRTLIRLIVISSPIFIVLYYTMETIFAFAFGDVWVVGAIYAKYLLPYFYVNFIVSALSTTDSIMERQHFYLAFNFILLISLILLVTQFNYTSIEEVLIMLSATMTLLYACYGVVSRFVAQGKL